MEIQGSNQMPKVIIIGASSGIGSALATIYAEQGFEIGLVARRMDLLSELQNEFKTKSYIKQIDIRQPTEAISHLQSLIEEMGDVDIFIVNSGVCYDNPELDWDKDKNTIEVNVLGFTSMANVALKYLMMRGKGQLVGISSVSAIRGESRSPVYSASKAFVSTYLEGIRHRMAQEKRDITVTDIQPGWVDTDMAKGEKTFWMAPVKEAAKEIYLAVKAKRVHAYITSRWRLYAWLLKISPKWFYDRFI